MSEKLKPCPLCGTAAQMTVLNHGLANKNTVNISCGDEEDETTTCGLVLFGGSKDTRETMISKWNKRNEL